MPDTNGSRNSALSSKNFRIFLYGNTVSVLGIWIQRLAMGWQAWQLSESSLVVGVVAAGQFLPLLLFTPFFGVLVDRIRPRYGAIIMHIVMMAIALVMGALTLANLISIELLVLLSFCHGIANSAYSPIRMSLIPDLVPNNQFPSAVAISAVVFNTSRFIGPGIAGAIVTLYGLGFAYIANGVSYLPVILSLLVIRTYRVAPDASEKKNYLAELAEGLRYTLDHPTIRKVIVVAGVSTFFGRGILEIMPAFAALIFDGGSAELAVLMAAAGAGAVLTSLVFSVVTLHSYLSHTVVIGAVGVGLSMFLFAYADTLTLGIVAVGLLGVFSSMVSIGSQSEVQIKVDNRLRGRVVSLWTLVLIGGPALGSIVAGWMAEELGSTTTLYTFAVVCMVLVVIGGTRKPNPVIASKEA